MKHTSNGQEGLEASQRQFLNKHECLFSSCIRICTWLQLNNINNFAKWAYQCLWNHNNEQIFAAAKTQHLQYLKESPVCDEFRKTLSKIGETKYFFYITLRQNSQAFYAASVYLSINKNGCQALHFRECTIFILQLLNISSRWAKVLYFVL